VGQTMQRPTWNLLTGTIAKYVLLFVNIVLGIVLMPFTMSYLGKAEYGLWMLAASMTAYLQLLDLGYGNGLVRQVTQADVRGSEDEINVILSTFFVVYLLIGLVALCAVAGLAVFVLPRFSNLSQEQVETARWVLAILGIRAAVAFPMGVFGAVSTARQRFAATGWVAIAVALLQALAIYVVLRAGYGLVTLVTATSLIGLASYLLYAAIARAAFPGMRLSISRFSRQQVREVTAFSLYLFLISVAMQLGYNLDNVVIAAFAGTSAVAVYAVAFRLADFQRQLCNQFNGLLFPLLVRFKEADDASLLRMTLLDGTRIALGMVTGVTVCLVAFGDSLIYAWMGPGFAESVWPLYVLAAAGVVLVAAGPLGNLLLAGGRHRLVAFSTLGEAIANLLLSIWLVKRYGIIGAALGTAISVTISNVFIQLPAACRMLHVRIPSFLWQVAAPSLLAMMPAIGTVVVLENTAELVTFGQNVLGGLVVGVIYFIGFVAIGLRKTERDRYAVALGQLVRATAQSTGEAGRVLLRLRTRAASGTGPAG
jgi:O-antigen/teichoic acid export membrane protein